MLRAVLRAIFTVIFKSPKRAALAPIYLGVSPDFHDRSGEYLHMFLSKLMDEKVYDQAEGEKLWRESSKLWRDLDSGAVQ